MPAILAVIVYVLPVSAFTYLWLAASLGFLPGSKRFWPFVVVGLVLLYCDISFINQICAMLLETFNEIVLTPTHLMGIQHGGPFRLTTKRRLEKIPQLRVVDPVAGLANDPRKSQYPGTAYLGVGIRGWGRNKREIRIASEYPSELLAAIAHFLSREISRDNPDLTLRVETPDPVH